MQLNSNVRHTLLKQPLADRSDGEESIEPKVLVVYKQPLHVQGPRELYSV